MGGRHIGILRLRSRDHYETSVVCINRWQIFEFFEKFDLNKVSLFPNDWKSWWNFNNDNQGWNLYFMNYQLNMYGR